MIFSVLAFVLLLISICIRDRKKSLIVQSLNCFFEAVYSFIINAYTGAILGVFNFIRSILFINKEKFSKPIYLFILFFFETIIIINCIFTYGGYISLLPTIGSMIRTYCLWQSDMKLVRISGMVTGVLYGLYYAYYGAWLLVLGDILLFIISIFSVFRYDIMNKEKRMILNANN